MSHLKLFLSLILLSTLSISQATDRRGHIGLGVNNQLQNGLPTLSLKFQGSRTFAFETLANFRSGDNGGYGVGLKVHRILFDEPQLNFYFATLIALEQIKSGGNSDTGFQTDFTLGTEFHFAGLKSLAFSIDFGFSLYKFDDLIFTTTSGNFVTAGIRFYL